MKKVFSLILTIIMALCAVLPVAVLAEEGETLPPPDMSVTPVCESRVVEVGDQFLVNFTLERNGLNEKEILPYLTFRMSGAFDNKLAKIVAPVYTNEKLGILTNKFDNDDGTFILEGYDQTISGTDEKIVCSILFEATNAGAFTVELSKKCMLGKANENSFYNLLTGKCKIEIYEDSNDETVSIINDPDPITPFDMDIYGHWAEREIGIMYKLGALDGIAEDSIDPDRYITRGEFVAMLMTVCKQKKSTDKPFNDASKESFMYEPLLTAKALGVANGDGEGNFYPDKPVTKQDMYTLIFRTMVKMNKVNPKIDADEYLGSVLIKEDIAPYAREPWAGMIRAKLIKPESECEPQWFVSIGEASVILNKLAEFNILVSR